jgi:hypothetical protein
VERVAAADGYRVGAFDCLFCVGSRMKGLDLITQRANAFPNGLEVYILGVHHRREGDEE